MNRCHHDEISKRFHSRSLLLCGATPRAVRAPRAPHVRHVPCFPDLERISLISGVTPKNRGLSAENLGMIMTALM
jgi:hypothetical protein